jgi:hypothetical protein
MSEITEAQKKAFMKLPGFKEIKAQYGKEYMSGGGKMKGRGLFYSYEDAQAIARAITRPKKMKGGRMKGMGFWDDVGDWFNQAGKDINQFLKDTKIVSNIASVALPVLYGLGAGLLTSNPIAATAAGVAGKSTADYIRSQGYGYVNQLSQVGSKKMLGKGLIYSQNGMLVKQPVQSGGAMSHMMPNGRMMKGRIHGGATTVFNTVSIEFSKVQF